MHRNSTKFTHHQKGPDRYLPALLRPDGSRLTGDVEYATPDDARTAAGIEFRHLSMIPDDPEGMNDKRAFWASSSVKVFKEMTGVDSESAICDILVGLAHLCDREGYDMQDELRLATMHYHDETAGKGLQLVPNRGADAAPAVDKPVLLKFNWSHSGRDKDGTKVNFKGIVTAAGTSEALSTVDKMLRTKHPGITWCRGKAIEGGGVRYGPVVWPASKSKK